MIAGRMCDSPCDGYAANAKSQSDVTSAPFLVPDKEGKTRGSYLAFDAGLERDPFMPSSCQAHGSGILMDRLERRDSRFRLAGKLRNGGTQVC